MKLGLGFHQRQADVRDIAELLRCQCSELGPMEENGYSFALADCDVEHMQPVRRVLASSFNARRGRSMRAIAIALSLAAASCCSAGIATAAVIKVPHVAVASGGAVVTPAFLGKLIKKAKSSVGGLARKP